MKKPKKLANELFEECYDLVEVLLGSEQAEDVNKDNLKRRYAVVVLRCLAFIVMRLSLLHTLIAVALGFLFALAL